jgi:hypothetical protein
VATGTANGIAISSGDLRARTGAAIDNEYLVV